MPQSAQAFTLRGWRPIAGAAEVLGEMALLAAGVGRGLRRRIEARAVLVQMEQVGVQSLGVVLLTAVFTGMVLALQMGEYLSRFGGRPYVGRILAISMLREMGPVLTALMLAGRVGAGITAEIGAMKASEQIDALRALGIDPVQKLVLPRVLALLFMVPALTVIANFIGILGGYVISRMEFGLSATFYFNSILQIVRFQDLFSGLGKTIFFAAFIALIACYNGLGVVGGADGVGRATTRTVVASSITILISDFFLTKLFLSL